MQIVGGGSNVSITYGFHTVGQKKHLKDQHNFLCESPTFITHEGLKDKVIVHDIWRLSVNTLVGFGRCWLVAWPSGILGSPQLTEIQNSSPTTENIGKN